MVVDAVLADHHADTPPAGRLAKLTRLDQARLSAAIDAALDDEEIKN